MHLNMCTGQSPRHGAIETPVIWNKKTPQFNSDCSGAHYVWLRVPEGLHTKTDRLNDLQLQRCVEFDTQKCTDDYQKSVRCHGFFEKLSDNSRFKASRMGERKTRARAYERKINKF
jgi:hypothetical protein